MQLDRLVKKKKRNNDARIEIYPHYVYILYIVFIYRRNFEITLRVHLVRKPRVEVIII